MNATNNGTAAKLVSPKACIIGINKTVTGTLSSNPERTEVKIKIIILTKKRFVGAMLITKSSNS